MGGAEELIMASSILIVRGALRSIRADNRDGAALGLKLTAAVGALYLALVVYEWSQMFVPVGTRFGENFYPALGVTSVYTLAGLFVLAAVSMRTTRVALGRDNYWDVQAVTWYWVFQAAGALAFYLYYYLL